MPAEANLLRGSETLAFPLLLFLLVKFFLFEEGEVRGLVAVTSLLIHLGHLARSN